MCPSRPARFAVIRNAQFSLLRKWVLGCLLLFGLTACSAPHGVWHQVERGQTLYRISKTYQVSETRIASINRIGDPTQLKVGTKLFIPGVSEVKVVSATTTHKTPQQPVKTTHKTTATKTANPKPASTKKTVASKPKSSTSKTSSKPKKTSSKSLPQTKKGKFTWPVDGKVVREFGGKGEKRCNGIEVAVGKGTPVHSSAAGKVIYSGNGIPGYGNLVILEHDDSYYTVYGFNQKNLVESGSFVSRGEKIALSGVPPSGGRSRIYFEVRYAKTPVNPILYLP